MSPSVQMNWHPTDDQLELYALQRLEKPETFQVEQHLLLCESCMVRQQQADEFVAMMQSGLRESANSPASPAWTSALWAWFAQPAPRWAMAFGTVVVVSGVLGVMQSRQEAGQQPVAATLEATRSVSDAALAFPAGRPLALRLKTEGLSASGSFHTEIADATGQPVWTGTAAAGRSEVTIQVDRKLAGGQYWVRLYENAGGELLREYALTLQ